jgi:solute carrier family 4 (sodium bicarbonate transporter), member 10
VVGTPVKNFYKIFCRIAAIETLMSGFVVGVLYGLFSGQPLTIMSLTGPILVFDTILYDFCK